MTGVTCNKCGVTDEIPPGQWWLKCASPCCEGLLLAPLESGMRHVGCGKHTSPVSEEKVIDNCQCGDRLINNILMVCSGQKVYESAAITPAVERLYTEFKATRDRLESPKKTIITLETDKKVLEKNLTALTKNQDKLYAGVSQDLVKLKASESQLKERNERLSEELEKEKAEAAKMKHALEVEIQRLGGCLVAKQMELEAEVEAGKQTKKALEMDILRQKTIVLSCEKHMEELAIHKEREKQGLSSPEEDVREVMEQRIRLELEKHKLSEDKHRLEKAYEEQSQEVKELRETITNLTSSDPNIAARAKDEVLSSRAATRAAVKRILEMAGYKDDQTAKKRKISDSEARAHPSTGPAAMIVKNRSGQIAIDHNKTDSEAPASPTGSIDVNPEMSCRAEAPATYKE